MPGRVRTRASAIVSNLVRILQSPAARLIGASVLVVVWLAMPIPPTSDAENILADGPVRPVSESVGRSG